MGSKGSLPLDPKHLFKLTDALMVNSSQFRLDIKTSTTKTTNFALPNRGPIIECGDVWFWTFRKALALKRMTSTESVLLSSLGGMMLDLGTKRASHTSSFAKSGYYTRLAQHHRRSSAMLRIQPSVTDRIGREEHALVGHCRGQLFCAV